MKKIVISALSLALLIGSAQAQSTEPKNNNTQQHQGRHRDGMAFKKLNLTEAQKSELKSLRESFRKDMADLKQNSNTAGADWKEKRKALHAQYKAKMEAVLTPEQKGELAKLKQNHRQEGKFKKDGGTAMNKWQQELNLTKDQQDKLTTIRSSYKDKFTSLRTSTSLTEEQKKGQMHDLRKQEQQELKAVLTPDQIQKWESKRPSHNMNKDTK